MALNHSLLLFQLFFYVPFSPCVWQECLLTLPHPSGAQELLRIKQFCRISINFPSSCVAFQKFVMSTGTLRAAQAVTRHGNPFHNQHQKPPSAEDRLFLSPVVGPCAQCFKLSSGLEAGQDTLEHRSCLSPIGNAWLPYQSVWDVPEGRTILAFHSLWIAQVHSCQVSYKA